MLALIAGMFLAAGLSWSSAPERIPVHWNVAGEVDRYGGKFEGLLRIPLLALAIYLLMLLLPRVDPGRVNYRQFSHVYSIMRLSIVLVLAATYALVQLWIHGTRLDVSVVVPVLIGALFVVLGNLMGKVRPNWFVGIRTPWTLSSKLSWTKTHRLGGWLFVLVGLALVASGFAGSPAFVALTFALIVGCVLFLCAYSYLVWRNDPEKTPPAGTLPGDGD